jgi:ketosteroid isomerase-like protein
MPTLTDVPFTQQDQATLRQMFETTTRSINAGDWSTWAALYADDGLLQPPNAPTIRGRPNILAWGQAYPPIESLTFSKVEIRGEGNMAYGTSGYTLKLKDSTSDTGKQLVVFRRATDNKWKVVAASFSSDLPGPGTSA